MKTQLNLEQLDNSTDAKKTRKPDWWKRSHYNDRQRNISIARKNERQDKENRKNGR